jgi:hypothetical protein
MTQPCIAEPCAKMVFRRVGECIDSSAFFAALGGWITGKNLSFNGWTEVPTELRCRCGLGVGSGSRVIVNRIAREEFGVADKAISNSMAHTSWEPTRLKSLRVLRQLEGFSAKMDERWHLASRWRDCQ